VLRTSWIRVVSFGMWRSGGRVQRKTSGILRSKYVRSLLRVNAAARTPFNMAEQTVLSAKVTCRQTATRIVRALPRIHHVFMNGVTS
jgi:hypothetical protein